MRLVALSQDKSILAPGATRERVASYGAIVGNLTVVLFGVGQYRRENIAINVTVVAAGGATVFSAFWKGMRVLIEESKDANLITAQDPFFLGFAGLWASRRNRVPLQIQVHTDFFSTQYAFESPRRMIEVLLARIVLKKATCVRAVSERVARGVRRITVAPVSVLPIRALPQKQSTSKPAEFRGMFTVLAVSRLAPEKQLSVLIDAIARMQDIDLIIVGDGPLHASLEQRAKRRGVEDRVKFAGRQDTDAYYQHADAFAQSSLYEGYGLTLVEAALAGLPIVTTDVGIVGNVLREGEEALVVSPNAEAFAKALLRLKSDEEFARTLGANAKKRAEGFQKTESEYLAVYRKALYTCPVRKI